MTQDLEVWLDAIPNAYLMVSEGDRIEVERMHITPAHQSVRDLLGLEQPKMLMHGHITDIDGTTGWIVAESRQGQRCREPLLLRLGRR